MQLKLNHLINVLGAVLGETCQQSLGAYTPVSSKGYALGDLIFLSRGVLKACNSQPYCEFLKRLWAKKALD